jgi:hypothetical protein
MHLRLHQVNRLAGRPEGQSVAFACHETILRSYGWIKQDGTPAKVAAG